MKALPSIVPGLAVLAVLAAPLQTNRSERATVRTDSWHSAVDSGGASDPHGNGRALAAARDDLTPTLWALEAAEDLRDESVGDRAAPLGGSRASGGAGGGALAQRGVALSPGSNHGIGARAARAP